MLDVNLKNASDHLADIAHRARERRLSLNLTQAELAERSGVSLGSVKRFENSGLISLSALLDIALVLGSLADFENLFLKGRPMDLFAPEPKKRLRGTGRRKA